MKAATRVGGFLLVIASAFGLALLVGSQVGAVGAPASEHASTGSGAHEDGSPGDKDEAMGDTGGEQELPGGLMVSQRGYTLALDQVVQAPGRSRPVTFTVQGPDGPVRAFDVQHEKQLHLVAVRRDQTGYQHVHPTLGTDGTWRTALDLAPGQWRLFADFKPMGDDALTLGADLAVPGTTEPAQQRPTTRVAEVDGYTVTLTGDLIAGEESTLGLEVSRDGQLVTDLQPYLGALGHLVALRSGDLAYLHVHPESDADREPEDGHGHSESSGSEVGFVAEVPSTGSYHLYFDFRHDDVVRTAQLRLDAERN